MALAFLFVQLCLLILQLPLRTIASAAPGKLAFFLDEDCQEASVINPSVNVPADTCLVTPGALGIAIQEYPACSSGSGNVTFKMYKDTSCANPVAMDFQYNNCYWDGSDGVPAINFVCNGAAATATSTVQAGSSTIPVAAGGDGGDASPSTTSSSGAGSKQTAPSSNDAATTTSSSSNPSQTKSGTNGDSIETTDSGKSSGISQRTQILLGVILPVGGIVVAVLAWWFPCKKGRKLRQYQHTHHHTHSQQQQHPDQYFPMQDHGPPSSHRVWS